MSIRFPPIPSANLTPAQRDAVSEADRIVQTAFGSTSFLYDSTGGLLGPFVVLNYTPHTFIPWLQHAFSIASTSVLTARERELATLAVCAVTKAEFIIYAHSKIGLSVGLSKEQVEAAVAGRPEGLGLEEQGQVVYELALELARGHGRLEEEKWREGEEVLGKEGMASLAQVVGNYLHASVLVNMAELKAPGEKLD